MFIDAVSSRELALAPVARACAKLCVSVCVCVCVCVRCGGQLILHDNVLWSIILTWSVVPRKGRGRVLVVD